MSKIRSYLKQVSMVMAVMLAFVTTFSTTAQARMVGTAEIIQQQQANVDRQQLMSMLDKQEVQDKLTQMGVSKERVAERIQNLTPSELADFNQQLSEAPAGEGVVGIIVLFLLVFIITDMLCATNVYSFVHCVR